VLKEVGAVAAVEGAARPAAQRQVVVAVLAVDEVAGAVRVNADGVVAVPPEIVNGTVSTGSTTRPSLPSPKSARSVTPS
jgi:hypothetical protein